MIMTSQTENQSYGPLPPPVLELTLEQQFRLQQITALLKSDANKERYYHSLPGITEAELLSYKFNQKLLK